MALINEACNITFNSNAWHYNDGTNRSAFRYFAINQASPLNGAALAGAFFTVILADGYLLVRCYRWWKNLWVIIPLGMLVFVSYVWDLLEFIYTAGHSEDGNSGWVMPFAGNWPITIGIAGALHVIYSALLAFWVIIASRKEGGEKLTIWSIAVESALPYGIISLIFMILYCVRVMAANAFIPMLVQLQGITVDLIITRNLKTAGQFASLPIPVSITPTMTADTTSMSDKEKLTL
ncbi:hypothetical protein DAEQUDRAFT_767827 [Daedalea quercina L-15889]|uniref:Uncharacterized protein n=1 Tax=Daedalea quercina L-15889 TaxID=1314783 RepID=A0A165N722_9APHY|nr:hypothetical protein DAEQUDRAFT_767827 [Daedalea quercina L-15889]